jgi:hypothetical protein
MLTKHNLVAQSFLNPLPLPPTCNVHAEGPPLGAGMYIASWGKGEGVEVGAAHPRRPLYTKTENSKKRHNFALIYG